MFILKPYTAFLLLEQKKLLLEQNFVDGERLKKSVYCACKRFWAADLKKYSLLIRSFLLLKNLK